VHTSGKFDIHPRASIYRTPHIRTTNAKGTALNSDNNLLEHSQHMTKGEEHSSLSLDDLTPVPIALSDEASLDVLQALQSPPEPNEALLRLAMRYDRMLRDR